MSEAHHAESAIAAPSLGNASGYSWELVCTAFVGCVLSWLGARLGIVPEAMAAWPPWIFLLAGGAGLSMRMNSAEPATLPVRPRLCLAARIVYAGLMSLNAIGLTALFIYVWFDQEPVGFGPGLGFVAWLLLAPMSLAAARSMFRSPEFTAAHESGIMSMILSVSCLLSALTLPLDCFSLRMFLVVASQVFCVVAGMVVVSQSWRRAVLSGFLIFHFAGIITATMSQPPGPWFFNQVWMRFYRPYLEFVYLNNAYRFFSPDPGPAYYFWFRVFFDSGQKDKSGEPILEAIWRRMPEVDDQGQHEEPASLLYQRLFGHTQNAEPSDEAGPSPRAIGLRLYNAPPPWKAEWNPKLGDTRPKPTRIMEIPLHPQMPPNLQFRQPTLASLNLIRSYCRHVGFAEKHPHHPEWPVHSIKVYRVLHNLASYPQFADPQMRRRPNDPETYYPYYLGRFDGTGRQFDDEDPFLYWLLPILREPPGSLAKDVPIRNWCHKHAGDPKWTKKIPNGPWGE